MSMLKGLTETILERVIKAVSCLLHISQKNSKIKRQILGMNKH